MSKATLEFWDLTSVEVGSWFILGSAVVQAKLQKKVICIFIRVTFWKLGKSISHFCSPIHLAGLLMLACFSRGEKPQMETVQKSKQASKLLDLYVFIFLLCGINDEIWVAQILKGSTISPSSWSLRSLDRTYCKTNSTASRFLLVKWRDSLIGILCSQYSLVNIREEYTNEFSDCLRIGKWKHCPVEVPINSCTDIIHSVVKLLSVRDVYGIMESKFWYTMNTTKKIYNFLHFILFSKTVSSSDHGELELFHSLGHNSEPLIDF